MKYLINHNERILIGWNPKCACGSTKTWFLQYIGHDYNDNVHKAVREMELPEYDYDRAKDYFKVIVIRDPFERFISGYLDKVVFNTLEWFQKYNRLDEFVDDLVKGKIKDAHFKLQTIYLDKRLKWDCIIQVENYNEGIAKLNGKLKTNIKSVHLGKGKGIPLEGYNKKIKQLIYKFYKKDFDYFKSIGVDYVKNIDTGQ